MRLPKGRFETPFDGLGWRRTAGSGARLSQPAFVPTPEFQCASGRRLLRQVRVPCTLVHNGQKRRVCDAGVLVQMDHAAARSAVPEVIARHRSDNALEIYGAIQRHHAMPHGRYKVYLHPRPRSA